MSSGRTPIPKSSTWRLIISFIFLAAVQLGTSAAAMPAPATINVRTLKEGAGAPITARDGAVINYIGRLSDGTVFDSNWHSKPVSLLVGQVIPGLAEALLRMREGGHYEVFVPADLGYGTNPPPGSGVPQNADLTFDVVVLTVVANAADEASAGRQ